MITTMKKMKMGMTRRVIGQIVPQGQGYRALDPRKKMLASQMNKPVIIREKTFARSMIQLLQLVK